MRRGEYKFEYRGGFVVAKLPGGNGEASQDLIAGPTPGAPEGSVLVNGEALAALLNAVPGWVFAKLGLKL